MRTRSDVIFRLFTFTRYSTACAKHTQHANILRGHAPPGKFLKIDALKWHLEAILLAKPNFAFKISVKAYLFEIQKPLRLYC